MVAVPDNGSSEASAHAPTPQICLLCRSVVSPMPPRRGQQAQPRTVLHPSPPSRGPRFQDQHRPYEYLKSSTVLHGTRPAFSLLPSQAALPLVLTCVEGPIPSSCPTSSYHARFLYADWHPAGPSEYALFRRPLRERSCDIRRAEARSRYLLAGTAIAVAIGGPCQPVRFRGVCMSRMRIEKKEPACWE